MTAGGYLVDFRARPALMLHQSNNELIGANAGGPDGDHRARAQLALGARTVSTSSLGGEVRPRGRRADGHARGAGAKRIVWVTLREPSESVIPPSGRRAGRVRTSGTSRTSTSASAQVAVRHPEVVLADWAAVSNVSGPDVRRHAPHVRRHPPDDRHHPPGRRPHLSHPTYSHTTLSSQSAIPVVGGEGVGDGGRAIARRR